MLPACQRVANGDIACGIAEGSYLYLLWSLLASVYKKSHPEVAPFIGLIVLLRCGGQEQRQEAEYDL